VIPFPAPSPIPEEETRLLQAARHGDAEAFTLLAKQYDRKIFRLALRITGNQEDASDALQEAFMKAYANLKTFHGDSRFYTWLARIAVNEALTKLRKRLAHKQVSLDDDNVVVQEIADFCDNPEQRYAKTETREIVQEAIHTLTPALRTVLLLQYLEDFTSEQIAQRLGLSVPAVKSRLMRARLKLRPKLGRHFRRLEVVAQDLSEAAWAHRASGELPAKFHSRQQSRGRGKIFPKEALQLKCGGVGDSRAPGRYRPARAGPHSRRAL
jgi:RNA polymerase sigma-70 factor (ECF subfamily)